MEFGTNTNNSFEAAISCLQEKKYINNCNIAEIIMAQKIFMQQPFPQRRSTSMPLVRYQNNRFDYIIICRSSYYLHNEREISYPLLSLRSFHVYIILSHRENFRTLYLCSFCMFCTIIFSIFVHFLKTIHKQFSMFPKKKIQNCCTNIRIFIFNGIYYELHNCFLIQIFTCSA